MGDPSVTLFCMVFAAIALFLNVAVHLGIKRQDEREREVFRQIDAGIEKYRREQESKEITEES